MPSSAELRIVLLFTAWFATAPAQAQPAAPAAASKPAASSPTVKLGLAAAHPITLQAGKGGIAITLTNPGNADAAVDLKLGPVVDSVTHAIVGEAKATPFLTGAGAPLTSVAHGDTLAQATLTGVAGVSRVEVTLFNGTIPLGSIPAIAMDAPLNIAVLGDNSPTKPIAYPYGLPVDLNLKNNDSQPYSLHWELSIEGIAQDSGDLDLAANGSSILPIRPCHLSQDWSSKKSPFPLCQVYSLIDLVHPSVKDATLRFTVAQLSGVGDDLLPARSIPLYVQMYRVQPNTTTVLSYGYVILLLGFGGFLSFVAGSVLPNVQRKSGLRAQVQELANRTSSVSTRVDSYLRVLLRLERNRINDMIDRAPDWFPESTDPMPEINTHIATLTKRLTVAEKLDELRRKHDRISGTAPPSVIDNIDATLQAVADQLHSFALTDVDLAAANVFLAKGQTSLDMLGDTDALAKLIAGNLAALQTRLDKFPPNYYSDLKQAIPGIFFIADRDRKFDDPKNITRPMFFAIDHGVAAIQIALDYAMVRASIPGFYEPLPALPAPAPAPAPAPELDAAEAPPAESAQASVAAPAADTGKVAPAPAPAPAPPTAAAPPRDAPPAVPPITLAHCNHLGDEIRTRLLKRQCVLFELLGKLSWRALREATLLVQEMREDIYEEDVLAEISRENQAEITFDSQKPRPYLPVNFAITFKNSRFNEAAALQRLLCHWKFPDGLEEKSWRVCHYFTGRESPLQNPVQNSTQNSTQDSTQEKAQLKEETPPWWRLWLAPSDSPCNTPLTIHVAIRGQRPQDSQEVPVPPLETVLMLEKPRKPQLLRAIAADLFGFVIAFGVALAGLASGALDQLAKLDFIPASVAIIALGFGANSIKNLFAQNTKSS